MTLRDNITTSHHADIDSVIKHIESTDALVRDEHSDPEKSNNAVKDFFLHYAEALVAMLHELQQRRDQHDGSGQPYGMGTHRVMIEGFSDNSSEEALSHALEKAKGYFAEDRDISITLQQLIELPQGGHRATLELHLTPTSFKLKPAIKMADIEQQRNKQHDFDTLRKKEDFQRPHLVYDHFAKIMGSIPTGNIPNYFLIQVNDANLMNYMIERQFFMAGHDKRDAPTPTPTPTGFAVKLTPDHNDD